MRIRYSDAADRWRSRTARFRPGDRFLHWLTLFLVATIFVLAFSIDFASSKEEAVALIQLHRSFGVTVWAVTLGRLLLRQFSRFPNWPADIPQAMRFAAQWSEYALYVLMLTQPILGLLWTTRMATGWTFSSWAGCRR